MNKPYPFHNRRDHLFGRQRDIAYLSERISAPGLTVIIGQHQAGKSWLLEEFGRQIQEEARYFVGWEEAAGPSPDLTLHAITDLYKRWLSHSTYVEQARAVWKQNKGKYLSGASRIFGELVEDLLGGSGNAPIGSAISSALVALNEANVTLKSSGIDLPKLNYGQAKELIQLVVDIGQRPAVLVLDALDQAEAVESEVSMLRSFLSQIDDWPHLHVLVSLYPSGSASN